MPVPLISPLTTTITFPMQPWHLGLDIVADALTPLATTTISLPNGVFIMDYYNFANDDNLPADWRRFY
jgi:hypothetical protein